MRDYIDYIHDMLDAMNASMEFIDNLSYEEFIDDKKCVYAMIRVL
jgi:uncharacterized protein with HEPN domain